MKIRDGFVSNSSSSSFLVQWKNDPCLKKPKSILSKDEVKLLKKFGFKGSNAYYPNQIWNEEKTKGPKHSLAYEVSCNQDDVAYFLLKNNIPFVASVHYEDEIWMYEKDSTEFLIIQNFGYQVMHHKNLYTAEAYLKKYGKQTCVRNNKNKYIKDQEKFEKDWKRKSGMLRKEIIVPHSI